MAVVPAVPRHRLAPGGLPDQHLCWSGLAVLRSSAASHGASSAAALFDGSAETTVGDEGLQRRAASHALLQTTSANGCRVRGAHFRNRFVSELQRLLHLGTQYDVGRNQVLAHTRVRRLLRRWPPLSSGCRKPRC